MGKGRLPVVMVVVVMLLAILVLPATTEAILVSFRNDMSGPVSVHCYGKDEGDLGLRFVGVGKTYDFSVPGHYFSGKRYSCTFVGTAKPITTFDVFVGWGGVHNKPCGCLGDGVCQWIVSNDRGFSCNNYSYTHPWGN